MTTLENQNGKLTILNGVITIRCSKEGWSAKFPSSCLKQMISDFQKKHTTNSFEMNTEPKYSKTEFEGWSHRFIVRFDVGETNHNMTIYSDSDNYKKLLSFIDSVKTSIVDDCVIVHHSSKEDDEIATEFINSINF